MSLQEGLAALKIDRSRGRSGKYVWKIVWLVVLAAIGAVIYTQAPRWSEQYLGADVSLAPVGYLEASKSELSAAGYVVADRMSVLAFKGTGRLQKLNVVESQSVAPNEIIAEIDHRELDAVIAQSRADVDEALADVDRLKALAAQAAANAAQAAATAAQTVASAANADAEIASAKAPLETLASEIKEIQIKAADAQRRYDRDKKLADMNAMPFSNADDHLTEIRIAEQQIATAGQRRQEILKKIAVTETLAAVARAQVTAAQAQVTTAQAAVDVAKAAAIVAERHAASVAARVKILDAQLADAQIFSPFEGVVIEKAAEIGEIVAPISIGGSMARGSIATIAERKSLQAEVDVAEAYISRVKEGQRAQIVIDAFPDKPLAGKVLRKMPRANRGKATVQVRVAIDDILRHKEILPDMDLRVKFLPDDAPPGAETNIVKKLAVKKAALQGPENARYVWVVKDGIATKSPVETGETKEEMVEIKTSEKGGVKEGQMLVIKGAERIKADGQKVRVTE